MRIFVTGASGWIGSAVVPELLGAGHQVVGLARSESSAEALLAAGAEVRRGSLDDLDVLAATARSVDGVIHLAFKHDIAFTGDFDTAVTADRTSIEALADALAGSDRPLVIASGTTGMAVGQVATENDGRDGPANAESGLLGRQANARYVLALADRGVRSAVLRLPPTVHGDGDNGFVPKQIDVAREKGVAAYIGDGSNRWPAVHRSDAATLFRLAVEEAPAGSILHAVADEGVPMRDIAATIGRHLDIPASPITPEDAGAHFGWLAGFLALDVPASSALTRSLLDWHPTGPGLLEDLDQGHYFSESS
ncbi:SDR family oxidoreductase [Mycolicibacterium sp. 050158]|uniref:SDR family oxidoreductase n=1 Tax=Mycolicibacterium sp. 050158 TaxID=3090602 RepID=UPI00299CDD32|nr:SDR family oxidoreductase [Mycolicibacterium sp. 050158]MDX1893355.1 SDR family oxidoreductase [Mycolicibacterium sp. 050158]